ncbi:MAG: L-serine ammonia-lyase, iron-sulfur-dependent, subunit alpha [Bacteroidales bacterium]|nr:L-serine ammonia-lyase, iron-sulfur-dependent, subunit alpha [Bacteroidales bacterium]
MNDKIKKLLEDLLPESYFKLMDTDDYESHLHLISEVQNEKSDDKVYQLQGDIEDFYIFKYNIPQIRSVLLKAATGKSGRVNFFRVFVNSDADFVLVAFYRDLKNSPRRNEFAIETREILRKRFVDEDDKIIKSVFTTLSESTKQIVIQCVNISFNTLLNNILETLDKQKLVYNFASIQQIKKPFKKADVYYRVEIDFSKKLTASQFECLSQDFERYIQTIIKPLSIFDMVGPAMVGPSSSHTAGANRIGQIARNIIMAVLQRGESIKWVKVNLLSSFRDTGVGHKTPSAIGGGLGGYDTDHPEMINHGEPEYLKQNGIMFGEQNAVFKGYFKGTPRDDLKYLAQRNNNIAEIYFETDISNYYITGFSIGAGNVEIRYFNKELTNPITGKIDFWLKAKDIVSQKQEDCPKIKKIFESAGNSTIPSLPFNSFEELDVFLDETGKSLIEVICETEYSLQKTQKEEIYQKMQAHWQIMKESVYAGVATSEKSLLKLSGGDAKKINEYQQKNSLFSNIYGKAASYSTAVNEINAKSGVIIACPTAGSCGILPGVLTAWYEQNPEQEDKILESLMISGFFGMILFTDVSTAGADYGCQAEIGAAAAMAASALTYLEGGTHNQMIEAFVLALKNSLGLICDPVAGLVEVPCVKRNGIYSSLAITAALMALSGVKSFISPDEIVLTMREVGERLHIDYKETGRAGLAKTRDGKEVEKDFEHEVNRFFG